MKHISKRKAHFFRTSVFECEIQVGKKSEYIEHLKTIIVSLNRYTNRSRTSDKIHFFLISTEHLQNHEYLD